MNSFNLPLQKMFYRLLDHNLPLGIEEYMVVLQALQAGFGIDSREDLFHLCRTVWTKDQTEVQILQNLFDKFISQDRFLNAENIDQSSRSQETDSLTKDGTGNSGTQRPPLDIPDRKPSRNLLGNMLSRIGRSAQESSNVPTRHSSEDVNKTDRAQSESKTSESASSFTTESTVPSPNLDEPIQVAQAFRQRTYGTEWAADINKSRFNLLTEYFPVTRRQMKQSWRQLRRYVREGPAIELDMQATIEKIGREGILLGPVLVPRRVNRAELIMLIDRDGSMVPFHALTQQLVETARQGGRLRRTQFFYFHDDPSDYLYRDRERLKAIPTARVLESIDKQTYLIIVSDAGAARKNLDMERVLRTRDFVWRLERSVRRCVWLNPMPTDRWTDTTAAEIAHFIPMSDMSRQGLDKSIHLLRGRHNHLRL